YFHAFTLRINSSVPPFHKHSFRVFVLFVKFFTVSFRPCFDTILAVKCISYRPTTSEIHSIWHTRNRTYLETFSAVTTLIMYFHLLSPHTIRFPFRIIYLLYVFFIIRCLQAPAVPTFC